MLSGSFLALLALPAFAVAHFQLVYPPPRGKKYLFVLSKALTKEQGLQMKEKQRIRAVDLLKLKIVLQYHQRHFLCP
jgi:hypothetical protein